MFKRFSTDEIKEIYNTYVLKDEKYYESHNNLSSKIPAIIPPLKYSCYDKDYPRLAAIYDLNNWLNKYNIRHFNNVLSTYKEDPELHMIKWDNITFAEFDGQNYDLHTLDLPDKTYDFIIINQTLEHVYNPSECVKNVYEHLRPGGYFFTSVPMINIDHCMPFYYWGMKPLGLALMCKSQGFNILETGSWGSKEYILSLYTKEWWPSYNTIGDTKNNPNFLAQCWILCQK
jgi:SAM-dependent methyltransferase